MFYTSRVYYHTNPSRDGGAKVEQVQRSSFNEIRKSTPKMTRWIYDFMYLGNVHKVVTCSDDHVITFYGILYV